MSESPDKKLSSPNDRIQIGTGLRNPRDFMGYEVTFYSVKMHRWDGGTETYDPSKTQIQILSQDEFDPKPRPNESPVTPSELQKITGRKVRSCI